MPEVPAPPGAAALAVADRLELHELLARYGHLLDEGRFDRLGEVFTPDVRYDATDFGGPVWHGLAQVVAGMRDHPAHPVAHHATNVVLSAPAADGSVRLLSKGPGVGRRGRVGSATYEDRAVRTGEGWRLASRTATLRRAAPRGGSGSPDGTAGPAGAELPRRVARLEALAEIGRLPIRYALAVDGRDVDAWVDLFTPDVGLGRHGTGRAALRRLIEPQLRWFYRSVHQVVGHDIELVDDVSATGRVYCRAEHEVGDRWIVMAICYLDEYRRVDGSWLFARRRELHWYAADVDAPPQRAGFDSWGVAGHPPPLPGGFPTWREFWAGTDTSGVTGAPCPGGPDRRPAGTTGPAARGTA